DVLKEASCHQAIQRAVERYGRLDILVNNAGTSIRKQPEDLTEQEWHLVVNTNLTSAFLCSQAAYPHMVRAGGGKIINIGSMMSIFGMPFADAGWLWLSRAASGRTCQSRNPLSRSRYVCRGRRKAGTSHHLFPLRQECSGALLVTRQG